MQKKFRLITRSDMDGIMCSALFKEMDMIDEIKFVHPKDMQDGLVSVDDRTITTNLPYVKGVHLCFEHHSSEVTRTGGKQANMVIDPDAPSAARVVWNYYGGEKVFKKISAEMMQAVDAIDSAQLTRDNILNPDGWMMLGFLMDNRTGLGRFHTFRISNYQLMMDLSDHFRNYSNVDDILNVPDVKERVDLYRKHGKLAEEQLRRVGKMHGKLLVLDLRGEKEIYACNRFLCYALFPDCNISMHILPGKQGVNTVFAVGKSVLDRSAKVNIGDMMLSHGGGGHKAAGTCQISNDKADATKTELTAKLAAAG